VLFFGDDHGGEAVVGRRDAYWASGGSAVTNSLLLSAVWVVGAVFADRNAPALGGIFNQQGVGNSTMCMVDFSDRDRRSNLVLPLRFGQGIKPPRRPNFAQNMHPIKQCGRSIARQNRTTPEYHNVDNGAAVGRPRRICVIAPIAFERVRADGAVMHHILMV